MAKVIETKTTLSELEAAGIKFVLIASNGTEHWRDDIKKKAGKILTYALVNLTQPTNLCSIETNFPYTDVYHRVEKTEKFTEDELTDIEMVNGNDEYYGYFLERENVTVVKTWGADEERTEEEILEYLQGNPIEL